jgi:hypothetical protein
MSRKKIGGSATARMSPQDFRRIALAMDGAVEGAHMGHPDFRVNRRIFATLHPDDAWGMVTLTRDEQQTFVSGHPAAFAPEAGAWGRQGCTKVRLDSVDEETLGEAMTLAWQHASTVDATRRRTAGAARPRVPSMIDQPPQPLRGGGSLALRLRHGRRGDTVDGLHEHHAFPGVGVLRIATRTLRYRADARVMRRCLTACVLHHTPRLPPVRGYCRP